MTKRLVVILTALLFAAALGCGGATESAKLVEQKKELATGKDAPFGPAGGVNELRAPTDRGAESDSKAPASKDIRVPGAQYGMGKDAAMAMGECPKGKAGDKCRKLQSKAAPFSDGIADLTAGIPWGLHYLVVLDMFEKLIRQNYTEAAKKVSGEIEEDRLRSDMVREIKKLRNSYISFTGQRTGYEGDVIAGEFTHRNGESMLKWDAGKYVEYLFFFGDRFWKRVRTFRRDSFESDIDFQTFIGTVASRLGEGKEVKNAGGALKSVMWQDKNSYAMAQDRSEIYGVYSLSFMAKVTENNLDKLRRNKEVEEKPTAAPVSNIVERVTSGEVKDNNASVVDSYTGAQGAPPPAAAPAPAKKTTPAEPRPKAAEKEAGAGDVDLF